MLSMIHNITSIITVNKINVKLFPQLLKKIALKRKGDRQDNDIFFFIALYSQKLVVTSKGLVNPHTDSQCLHYLETISTTTSLR
jgi:hypothetical protein